MMGLVLLHKKTQKSLCLSLLLEDIIKTAVRKPSEERPHQSPGLLVP